MGYGHAITLWGAAFDEDDNIIAIYVVDNNFAENRIFPYGIHYQKDIYADNTENSPYLFNFLNNTYDNKKYVKSPRWIRGKRNLIHGLQPIPK